MMTATRMAAKTSWLLDRKSVALFKLARYPGAQQLDDNG
jgi:hypothetical protein